MKTTKLKLNTPDVVPHALVERVMECYAKEGGLIGEDSATNITPAFRTRCRKAAAEALVVVKLRKEREQAGFVPLSLAEYLAGLAKMAAVSLEPWFKTLGLSKLSIEGVRSAPALARMAREIDLGLRELLAHLRIGIAEQAGAPPLPLLALRHRNTTARSDILTQCEHALDEFEAGHPKAARRARAFEAALRAQFAKQS